MSYLSRQGTIPDEAVIKKGEKRRNPFRENRRFDANKFERDTDVLLDSEDEVIDASQLEEMEG